MHHSGSTTAVVGEYVNAVEDRQLPAAAVISVYWGVSSSMPSQHAMETAENDFHRETHLVVPSLDRCDDVLEAGSQQCSLCGEIAVALAAIAASASQAVSDMSATGVGEEAELASDAGRPAVTPSPRLSLNYQDSWLFYRRCAGTTCPPCCLSQVGR